MKRIMILCIGLLGLLLYSCKKDGSGTAHLKVRMTDAPGNFDAVMIDLQAVEVTGAGGAAVLTNINAGIYNLLDFSNGVDTLIATGDITAGEVSQIRLILGPNNSVIVDGVTYPLSTPSAMQSGLKLQVHQTFEPGITYYLLLDFDANQSIVLQGNGNYQLKPVIRVIDAPISGSIRGSITPLGILAAVTATSNGVSYSSVTNLNGEFLISGLPSGTYDITVTPALPMLPVTITGVAVTTGVVANVGIVAL
ncbi:MAG: DUF4382 domain-containing protein [Bacteroidota bacterium]